MKNKIIAAVGLAFAATAPANAGILLLNDGSAATYNFPSYATAANSVFFNFNVGDPSANANYGNFTRTGGTLLTGDTVQGASPESFGNAATQYLSTVGGATTTIAASSRSGFRPFDTVSFFLGSIDSYNTVNILSTSGAILASLTGAQLSFTPNGNQDLPTTNRRVTFTRQAGDEQIAGISFTSGQNSLEVENLVFTVPEPSTWALMIVGFGMVGFAMRSRRHRTTVVYA
jgi:hypothetical protein